MAGIYIHIPFCRRACHYCDFHFSTSLHYFGAMMEAIAQEIKLSAHYFDGAPIESVYFGGGTPTLFGISPIRKLLDLIFALHPVLPDAEITIEANPDDINSIFVQDLRSTSINRLSLGIQSFHDSHLQWMNRSHTSNQAIDAISRLQDAGFLNLNIDLIYGFDALSHYQWQEHLNRVLVLNVPHVSAYCLTVEEKTPLAKYIRTGQWPAPDEQHVAEQWEILTQWVEAHRINHYEISNLCVGDNYAKHNTSYWLGKSYLGIGPSAHGFQYPERYHNVANNQQYINAIKLGKSAAVKEKLSPQAYFNEQLLTGLRTVWGADISSLPEVLKERKNAIDNWQHTLSQWIDQGKMVQKDTIIYLTPKGRIFADGIAASLFI